MIRVTRQPLLQDDLISLLDTDTHDFRRKLRQTIEFFPL
jgi:hypothetical protein